MTGALNEYCNLMGCLYGYGLAFINGSTNGLCLPAEFGIVR